jgi:hypothetical protein
MIKYKSLKQDRQAKQYKHHKSIMNQSNEIDGKIQEPMEWNAENITRKTPPPRLTPHKKVFNDNKK